MKRIPKYFSDAPDWWEWTIFLSTAIKVKGTELERYAKGLTQVTHV